MVKVPTLAEHDHLVGIVADIHDAANGLREAVNSHDALLVELSEASSTAADGVARNGARIATIESSIVGMQAGERRLADELLALQRRVDALTPAGPEVPEPSMLVGSSLYREPGESFADAFARRTADWGKEPQVVRFFFSGLPTQWPSFGAAKSVVSFKGNPVEIASGVHDAVLTRFFDSAPKDRGLQPWVYFHEREDNVERGEFTEAQWRAAHKHLVSLSQAVGPHLDPGMILMGWTVLPASGRNIERWLDASIAPYLGWVGWDSYPENPFAAEERYGRCADATRNVGIHRYALCETAPSKLMADKAAWVTDTANLARTLGFEGYMYFDNLHEGHDFRLLTDTEHDAIAGQMR